MAIGQRWGHLKVSFDIATRLFFQIKALDVITMHVVFPMLTPYKHFKECEAAIDVVLFECLRREQP